MKLKQCKQKIEEKFQEFDIWVTPNLFEIKDTNKYLTELENTKEILEIIGAHNKKFQTKKSFKIEQVSNAITKYANSKNREESIKAFNSSISLLFLVTGKSDNNVKCQFPLYLRDISKRNTLPAIRKKKGELMLSHNVIPRELKSLRVSTLLSDLKNFEVEQISLYNEYISFILNEEPFINSFWAIGKSYFSFKKDNIQDDFLMPLIIFKVRGSVSASGGHDPEEILRSLMKEWGMTPDFDFNLSDIIIGNEKSTKKIKTRAYDFVLPYKLELKKKLLIQCQFYAGDSGSVSHKNVDQTVSSRTYVKKKMKNSLFIEYLDGAGYFSSLNGDLKSILSMKNTFDFFQLRTAPIKLRRNLQLIGFLTPLDLVHAAFENNCQLETMIAELLKQGYVQSEIDRSLKVALENMLIKLKGKEIHVSRSYKSIARKYYLLDMIYNASSPIPSENPVRGYILIPGLNGKCGIKLSDLPKIISADQSELSKTLKTSTNLLSVLQELSETGWIINV